MPPCQLLAWHLLTLCELAPFRPAWPQLAPATNMAEHSGLHAEEPCEGQSSRIATAARAGTLEAVRIALTYCCWGLSHAPCSSSPCPCLAPKKLSSQCPSRSKPVTGKGYARCLAEAAVRRAETFQTTGAKPQGLYGLSGGHTDRASLGRCCREPVQLHHSMRSSICELPQRRFPDQRRCLGVMAALGPSAWWQSRTGA